MSKQVEHQRRLRRSVARITTPFHLANIVIGFCVFLTDDPSPRLLGWALYLFMTDLALSLATRGEL